VIWVIDASVAVRWLIEDEAHPSADSVLETVLETPERFAVPELFAFEVLSVLLRMHPNGLEAFTEGIMPLLQSGLFRQPMTKKLASQANRYVGFGLTGYDACYAALAKDLGGLWLTYDKEAHRLILPEKVSFLISEAMPESWPG